MMTVEDDLNLNLKQHKGLKQQNGEDTIISLAHILETSQVCTEANLIIPSTKQIWLMTANEYPIRNNYIMTVLFPYSLKFLLVQKYP